MVAAGLILQPLCLHRKAGRVQLIDTVVSCSALSALVAAAASIHCAGELLEFLKELNDQFQGLAHLLEYRLDGSVLHE